MCESQNGRKDYALCSTIIYYEWVPTTDQTRENVIVSLTLIWFSVFEISTYLTQSGASFLIGIKHDL